ncbi:AraC-like DNA-binding protein [Paenarthrobacter nitroguajacolicus]|uniref:AraC family transcriptional regulator n=1 Tax=Paenarthrobacter nitroguajacolicus TaxID=211146 RepID=UPI002858B274|nr:AraC family transcriptional regulator [Paenarthrobacter nitroguajacolicus]MDR6986900.1 AraC-like DNA-binding protein [Paenarthrobacter nitroguajacolicus]
MVRILARDVLRGRPTTATTDVDEAHAKIAELFCSHELAPRTRQSSVDMKLRSLHRGDVGIEFLDYGADVRIEPDGLEDFHLVQIPLAGHASMQVGASPVESSPRMATVPPIDQPFSMSWDRGSPHLIVYVRRTALERVAWQLNGAAPGGLAYGMDLSGAAGRAFLRAVVELHDDMIGQPQTAAPVFMQGLLADTMVSRLLMAMEPPADVAGDGDAESRLVRECRELLERHAFEELTVPDIAECLGVSVRTLQTALRAETGATPSELLRSIRLDRAREMLLEASPREQTVTAVAELCGFTHQGRFSSLYLKAFGELPSESLRR